MPRPFCPKSAGLQKRAILGAGQYVPAEPASLQLENMDRGNVPPTSTSDNAEEARAPTSDQYVQYGPPFRTTLQPLQPSPVSIPMYSPNPVPYPFTAASAQSYSGLASVPPGFSPSLPSYLRYDDPVLQRNVGPVSQPIAGPISQHTNFRSQPIAGPISRSIATPMSQPIDGPMLQPIAGARPLSAGLYNPHGHPVPYPPRQVSSPALNPVQISSRPHPQEVANPNLIPFQGYQLQPSPLHAKPVSRPCADSFQCSPAPAKQFSSRSFNPIGSYRPSSPSAVPYSVRQVASSALNSSSHPVRRQQEPPSITQEMQDRVNREVIRINSIGLIMQSQQILTKHTPIRTHILKVTNLYDCCHSS